MKNLSGIARFTVVNTTLFIILLGGYAYFYFIFSNHTNIGGIEDLPKAVIIIPIDPIKVTQEVDEEGAVLLDVRTIKEIEEDGYALGSTHFEFSRLLYGELPNVSHETRIYTYCKGGVRAEEAKKVLLQNGFHNTVNIGGLSDWIDSGGEVVYE
jgi:rhodanese-related sulfurtransferase